MKRLIFTVTLLNSLILASGAGLAQATAPPTPNGVLSVWGQGTNFLKPQVFLERLRGDWHVNIDFLFETNFGRHAWLRVTNRVGAMLELWLPDGTSVLPRGQDAAAALRLPRQTTVENIMRGIPLQNHRGMQWLQTGFQSSPSGIWASSATFGLSNAFAMPITNDVTLRITPLLYRVATNAVTARLVEFPPLDLSLSQTGAVQVLPPAGRSAETTSDRARRPR